MDVSAANGSCTVFMRNLAWAATEDDIRNYLSEAGPIAEVRIAIDHDNRPKGFAHIQFESVEGAAQAIAMTGGEIAGREVHIETTTERQPRKSFFIYLSTFLWEKDCINIFFSSAR